MVLSAVSMVSAFEMGNDTHDLVGVGGEKKMYTLLCHIDGV